MSSVVRLETLYKGIRSRAAFARIGLQYVSVYSTSEGNDLCAPTSTPSMNGMDPVNQEHSYHPNQFDHGRLAETVASALASPGPGVVFNVRPGESITSSFQVSSGDLDVSLDPVAGQ